MHLPSAPAITARSPRGRQRWIGCSVASRKLSTCLSSAPVGPEDDDRLRLLDVQAALAAVGDGCSAETWAVVQAEHDAAQEDEGQREEARDLGGALELDPVGGEEGEDSGAEIVLGGADQSPPARPRAVRAARAPSPRRGRRHRSSRDQGVGRVQCRRQEQRGVTPWRRGLPSHRPSWRSR